MADAPSNNPYLGMGRPIVDRAVLEMEGVQPSVIEALMGFQNMSTAMGYATAIEGSGNAYQNVVARYVSGNWTLYAARPDTPPTPDTISLVSGGAAIIVELNNVEILATATTLNFSSLFNVTNAGLGQVDVDIITDTVEVWGLDPAGGHTIAVTGTGEFTINLKILKQVVTVFGIVSSTQDDLPIVYTGGDDCPP